MSSPTVWCRGTRSAGTAIQHLESRCLFSFFDPAIFPAGMEFAGPFAVTAAEVVTPPAVTATQPADGSTGVLRDGFINAELSVPNGGIDEATLTADAVRIFRTSDGSVVPSVHNTSAAGDIIVVRPLSALDANTNYTFEVTSSLLDVAGVAFNPFAMSFTTGTALAPIDSSARFQQVAQSTATGEQFTSVVVGPDHRLYAGTLGGDLFRFAIGPDGMLGPRELVSGGFAARHGASRLIMGLAFDPAATADNLVLWLTHTSGARQNTERWAGKVTRLSGPDLQNVADVVIGLPRAEHNHFTNQLTFGPDGAIYIVQGSNTAMGGTDSQWGFLPERLLSCAILRLDPQAVSGTLNAQTEDGGTYDPFAPGAPLTIYGSGARNSYDLVWHRNGSLYVPTNGSSSGGNTPGTPNPIADTPRRIDETVNGPYTGPAVPSLTHVQQSLHDYLFRVEKGGYYGHPNPARSEFVMNGGNPTAGDDPAQVNAYPVGTLPDRNWRGFAFDFNGTPSANGIIEYRGNAFGGALAGKLLVVRYSGNDDIMALTPGIDGNIVQSQTGIIGLTGFDGPLDLIEDRANGNIYLAEFGAERITLLRPVDNVAQAPAAPSGLSATGVASDRIDLAWSGVAGATAYQVQRSPDGSNGWADIGTPSAGVTTFSDTGRQPSTTYHYRVRATNAAGPSPYSPVAFATTLAVAGPSPGTGTAVLRINSAGGAFTDAAGNRWEADRGVTGGTVSASSFPVAGTTDDALYYTRRFGNFRYNLAVPDGSYRLRLHTSEPSFGAAGKRKFDLFVEDQQVLNDYDLYADAGKRTAVVKEFAVIVTGGQLNLRFVNVVNNAIVSAVELLPSGDVLPPPPDPDPDPGPGSGTDPIRYEAETATFVGPVVKTGQSGFTGTGFVDFQNTRGDYLQWTINAPAAGTYRLGFRYANGGGSDRPLELRVDGTVLNPRLSFAVTGGWTTWATVEALVTLGAGNHTVRLTSIGSNGANFDSLIVS